MGLGREEGGEVLRWGPPHQLCVCGLQGPVRHCERGSGCRNRDRWEDLEGGIISNRTDDTGS